MTAPIRKRETAKRVKRAPKSELGETAVALAAKPGPAAIASWPELKLELVRKYAAAYSRIMSRQPGLSYYYIEGFSGADVRVNEPTCRFAAGSPLNALLVEPPFRHHFLLDMDGGRAPVLRRLAGERADVTVLEGDASELLLRDVLPRVRAEDYRRALCVLDPCGTTLDWRVIETAGRLKTIDLFVSLPLADERFGHFWGDDRLREVARFDNVPEPLPLRARDGALTGHLFFASRADTANQVLEEIFARHRG